MREYSDYPVRSGVILGFGTAQTEYLDYIKQDMGLIMPMQTLSYIQNHYRLIEKRDCDAAELILIDIMFANVNERLLGKRNYCVSEMITDSDEIRETMEDMMAKLAAMGKGAEGPISFDRMISASSNYIASIFPERAVEHFEAKYIAEDEPCVRSMLDGSMEKMLCRIEEISFAISSSKVKNVIKRGYYIQIKNSEAIADFLSELHKSGIEFCGWKIENDLLSTILSDTASAEITVSFALPEMATYGKGDILILCREKDEMEIVRMGMERELLMRRAGIKNKKGKILLKASNRIYAFEGEFLRKFAFAEVLTPVNLKIFEDVLCGDVGCALKELSYEGEIGNLSVACAESDMSAPYRSGISQVLCAAASQIALGASIEDIRLKTVVSCPRDIDPAMIFAHILGIYRAEIELCLSSHGNELHISDDFQKISSLTVAHSNTNAKGTTGGGNLFVLSPCDADGRICFGNVRRTFDYVSSLIRSGHVIRACALDPNGLKDSSDENNTLAAGSFLILTDAELCACDGVSVTSVGVIGTENDPVIV